MTSTRGWFGVPGAIILALSLFCCSSPPKTQYDAPFKLSYSQVPGFTEDTDRVLEWGSAATQQDTGFTVAASLKAPTGLRIRWLGTAGYEISDDSTVILIDPFVTRPTFAKMIKPLKIDTGAVNHYVLDSLNLKHVKAILVSHPHHDHFQDIPYILAQYPDSTQRPLVVGTQNVHDLVVGYSDSAGIDWLNLKRGLQDTRTKVVAVRYDKKSSCEVGTFGNFKITAFPSDHSSYDNLGPTAIGGSIRHTPPVWSTDYKMRFNTSIGYLIDYRGLRIFVTESPIVRQHRWIGKVAILIQGIAARKEHNTIIQTLASLQPDVVIPTHYDNFFKPLTDFTDFDTQIGFYFLDFSRFEQFIQSFESYYVKRARARVRQNAQRFHPKLRLMKLLYYYSLRELL
ncbi:MAG: MBL fold metallo-hydrolase [bacterium]